MRLLWAMVYTQLLGKKSESPCNSATIILASFLGPPMRKRAWYTLTVHVLKLQHFINLWILLCTTWTIHTHGPCTTTDLAHVYPTMCAKLPACYDGRRVFERNTLYLTEVIVPYL